MYNKVLVPLDGSELAECVFPHLQTISGGCGVQTVTFLRVVKPFFFVSGYMGEGLSGMDIARINQDNTAAAENYMKQLATRVNVGSAKVQWEVLTGNEAESIVDYAKNKEVDLIMIATHGRSGVSRWVWGSVADRVLRSACVPVLMVRAPGCVPGI